ncbi:MAG: hypothetical protein ACREVE_16160 [Gammaproteobacteria bacterium]
MTSPSTACQSGHLLRADNAPATGRFLVYCMCVNGEKKELVPAWRLLAFLRGLKLLNVYREICTLPDGGFFECSAYVHGQRLNLAVRATWWSICSNPECVSLPGRSVAADVYQS